MQDQRTSDVLGIVARRLGVQVSRTGSLYFLGTLRPEDKGVLVRRVRRLSSADLQQATISLLSDVGRLAVMPDGLCVVGDRVEVLQRVNELFDAIDSATDGSIVVQLHLVSLSATAIRELGLETTPTLDVAATFAGAASGGMDSAATLTAGLRGVLNVAASDSSSHVIAQPLFVCVEGSEAKLVRGERIPVPKRVVSDQGTVTTSGFDYIQTGLDVGVIVRETGGGLLRVTLNVQQSSKSGEIEGSPIVANEGLTTEAAIQPGGVYLLGSLDRREDMLGTGGRMRLGFADSRSDQQVQVWLRAYRVGTPAGGPLAVPREARGPADVPHGVATSVAPEQPAVETSTTDTASVRRF